jgi:hypothetical protein
MWKCTCCLSMIATLGLSAQTITPSDANALTPPHHRAAGTPITTYMMISPSARALDFQQAFEQMRKEKSTGKVYFELADGTIISNIIDMTMMTNATLIMFRFNSNQGIRFQVVKVEDILNIRY